MVLQIGTWHQSAFCDPNFISYDIGESPNLSAASTVLETGVQTVLSV